MINVNSQLVSRIFDRRTQLGRGIHEKVRDIIEKYGMVNLDKAFMEQNIGSDSLSQELVKFHLYHWLYDCVATLDAAACLFNLKFSVRDDPRHVAMNKPFIDSLKEKSPKTSAFLNKEFSWMKQLKDMRDSIIHREGRLIVGGYSDPCVVIDINRFFVKDLPLHRQRVPEITEDYMKRLDAFIENILLETEGW